MKRSVSRLLRLLSLTAVLAAAGGTAYVAFYNQVVPELDRRIDGLRTFRPLNTCTVLGEDGSRIDEFYVERRFWVSLDEMSPMAWLAVVAAEDRRFFEHPGVDLLGIARAMVVNIAAGRIEEGGSTITQQVVKNLVVGNERSYRRKALEALLAWRLETQLSKERILELYVNMIYLGSGNYGLEAAAQDYFGLSAAELDAGQAAMLAGLIPAPSRYSPRRNPDTARVRRAIVLRAMVEEGYVTEDQAAALSDAPLETMRIRAGRGEVGTAYITAVRREVRRLLGNELPVRHGLVVHTPYDARLQAVAEEAIEQAAAAVEERQGMNGPLRTLDREGVTAFLARNEGLSKDPMSGRTVLPAPGNCFPIVLGASPRQPVRAGGLELKLVATDWQRRVRSRSEEDASKTLADTRPEGQVWRACLLDDGQVEIERTPWVQGAAVVIENSSGRIVALTGGRGMTLEGFSRATQARRQPGSSFKPYVYAASLLHGRRIDDIVVDGPIALPAGGGQTWSPKNYDGGYAGAVTLKTAMAKSLNTVAVRLTMETGPEAVAELARAMGVSTPLRTDLTLSLGSSEVTPMDQAVGMATIARMGVSPEAHLIVEVQNTDGEVEGLAGGPVVIDQRELARLPGGPGRRVLPGGIAYNLVEILGAVVTEGTARRARRPDQPRIGKTGTASSFTDAWFVGATPTHSIAVWIGTDGMQPLGPSETGGKAALPVFVAIADTLPTGEGVAFPLPDDAVPEPGGRVGSRSSPGRDAPVLPDGPPLPFFPRAQGL